MPENTETTAHAGEQQTEFKAPASQEELDQIIKNRLDRERAKYADYTDLKSAAERLAKIEDEQKTEIQRATERATQAEQRAQELERAHTRLQVLAGAGIPEEYHDLVVGDTEETLRASAAKVKKLLDGQGEKPVNSYVLPTEGGNPNLALNGDGIETALRNALGIAQ